jgi:hypothetical protein
MARKGLSTPNMLSGANVLEISDIQDEGNRKSVLKKSERYIRSKTCHRINSPATGWGALLLLV